MRKYCIRNIDLESFFFLVFGGGAFQNSLLKLGSGHWLHHQKVDLDDDPPSVREGFFHAGWILGRNQHILFGKVCPFPVKA